MALMRKIQTYLQARRLRASFDTYISADAVKHIATHPHLWQVRHPLEEGQIHFVCVRVRAEPLNQGADHFATVVERSYAHHLMAVNLFAPLVSVHFALPPDPQAGAQRQRFVADLQHHIAPHLAILHGSCTGLYGNLGHGMHLLYGPIIPGFQGHLAAVLQLAYGQVREV